MSKLRAFVYQDRAVPDIWWTEIGLGDQWPVWTMLSLSHPEALQAAHLMLRDLDRLLLDQVHAERTARRVPRITPDPYTMEPTA